MVRCHLGSSNLRDRAARYPTTRADLYADRKIDPTIATRCLHDDVDGIVDDVSLGPLNPP